MPSQTQRTEPWQFPGRREVRPTQREAIPKERGDHRRENKPSKKFPRWAQ